MWGVLTDWHPYRDWCMELRHLMEAKGGRNMPAAKSAPPAAIALGGSPARRHSSHLRDWRARWHEGQAGSEIERPPFAVSGVARYRQPSLRPTRALLRFVLFQVTGRVGVAGLK